MNKLSFLLPHTINAGDSINQRYVSCNHPATDGWVMVFLLRNSTDQIDLTSTPDGDAHLIKQTPAQTNGYVAGNYVYRAQMVKSDETITVGQGHLRIAPSFANGAIEARGPAQIAYDNVTAMLAGKGDTGVYEYEIRGRRLKSYTIPELIQLQSHLRRELDRENIANGIATNTQFRGQIQVRFGNV